MSNIFESKPAAPDKIAVDDPRYYKEKMATNREEWADIGIVHTSLLLPEEHRDYFKAVASILNGQKLLDLIDNGDKKVIETFAGRRPRAKMDDASVKLMMQDAKANDDENLQHFLGRLDTLIGEYYKSKRDADVAFQSGLEETVVYHYAREYALATIIRGSLLLAELKRSGSDLPERVRI